MSPRTSSPYVPYPKSSARINTICGRFASCDPTLLFAAFDDHIHVNHTNVHIFNLIILLRYINASQSQRNECVSRDSAPLFQTFQIDIERESRVHNQSIPTTSQARLWHASFRLFFFGKCFVSFFFQQPHECTGLSSLLSYAAILRSAIRTAPTTLKGCI